MCVEVGQSKCLFRYISCIYTYQIQNILKFFQPGKRINLFEKKEKKKSKIFKMKAES